MLITIEDKVYDMELIDDEDKKLAANIMVAKANHHRLNAEGSQILVNTYENGLATMLKELPEIVVEPIEPEPELEPEEDVKSS